MPSAIDIKELSNHRSAPTDPAFDPAIQAEGRRLHEQMMLTMTLFDPDPSPADVQTSIHALGLTEVPTTLAKFVTRGVVYPNDVVQVTVTEHPKYFGTDQTRGNCGFEIRFIAKKPMPPVESWGPTFLGTIPRERDDVFDAGIVRWAEIVPTIKNAVETASMMRQTA
jgi:hypothetical protein